MSRGTIVEFCGLPGAGKTTLSAALRASVCELSPIHDGTATVAAGVPAGRRVSRKIALAAGHAGRDPVGTARLARAVLSTSEALADPAARLIQWTVTQRLFARARAAGGLHVFDEGVLQALWSMGLRAEVAPVLHGLADGSVGWSRPDLVVLVDEHPDVALQRLRARPSRHSRLQLLDAGDQQREMRAGHDLLERLASWYTTTCPDAPEVLRVSVPRSPETALPEIAERIRDVCADGTRSPGSG